MSFTKVAQTNDIAPGSMKNVACDGKEILVVNLDGEFYAISHRCTHMAGRLSEGTLKNGIVTCPKHGAKFDVRTGRAIEGAKMAFVKMKVRDTRCYEVKIEGDDILISVN